jgi:LuxR family maltose regulon positive regulatory protein
MSKDARSPGAPTGTDGAHGVPTVATKLRVPPLPRGVLVRQRLLDVLDAGVGERLVLLSAPAGAGKTVLLSSWLKQRELPGTPCWLTLDADDNDVSRLLADLLSALHDAGVAAPGDALAQLGAPLGAHTERFLPLLVNALAGLREPVVVVLDEIQQLTSPPATATLDFLVRYAPAQLRLVLAGRADPPLPIERLRVTGELIELRIADLAFDREETASFCRALELGLAEEEMQALWRRTEGWAAALRLAALSLQGHPERGRFLAELSGTDRVVSDYLVSEVLAQLSPERREFMLRTCVVESVSPELADALTDLDTGSEMLAALEHSGVPIHPLDSGAGGCWYCFHPLFRELLRAHLQYAHPQEVHGLHRRAAAWYAEQGETMPAIRHALTGHDWEQAGELIADNWLDLFLAGRTAAMCDLMAQLPADVLAADPRLATAFAGSRLQDGDLQDAGHYLALARHARSELPAQARGRLDVALATVALHEARLRSDANDAQRLARRLDGLARGAGDRRWSALRSFALASVGAARLWSGGAAAAAAALREGRALATEHHHEQIALDCLAQLAVVHLLHGELTTAQDFSERAVELAERRGWCTGPAAAAAYLASAAVAYQRAEIERAEGLLSHASSAASSAEAPVRMAVVLLHALVLAAAGPKSAARGALKLQALRTALGHEQTMAPFLRVALADAQARVLLAAGELDAARAALERGGTTAGGLPECAELDVRRAAIELRAGAPARAERALTAALAGREPRPATLLEAWLLRALLEREKGEPRAAAQALDRALAVAEREPFRAAFLLGEPGVCELLEAQAQTGTEHPALLEVLLDGAGVSRTPVAPLVEPLTEREQRILRYLPTMLSNAEIGAEVYVSLNTVKTHLRSIYRKLGASGRADAVEKARAHGLLPSGIKRPVVVRR